MTYIIAEITGRYKGKTEGYLNQECKRFGYMIEETLKPLNIKSWL